MDATQQHINKFREERIAKEKARIEKLRQLNVQKYSKHDLPSSYSSSFNPDTNFINKMKTISSKSNLNGIASTSNQKESVVKTKHIENKVIPSTKNTITSYIKKNITNINIKSNNINVNKNKVRNETNKATSTVNTLANKNLKENTTKYNVKVATKTTTMSKSQTKKSNNISSKLNNNLQSTNEKQNLTQGNVQRPTINSRETVFDRLYKPKVVQKQTINNALKLQSDPNYLKEVIQDSRLIMNKRHTTCNNKSGGLYKKGNGIPVRRSISAVHFKRIRKSELENCIHKWASIGEKINKQHLENINEDEDVKEERVVSAVKAESERKRGKFQTPFHFNFNTPKPEELQSRLKKWLQKRGKSIDSYHHLQCFGLHYMSRDIKQFNLFDDNDENKENVAVENDSDNDSYLDNMNNENSNANNENSNANNENSNANNENSNANNENNNANNENSNANNENKDFAVHKWRRASVVSDSVDFNESYETTLNSEVVNQVDELLLGTLNDLTELLKEGFDWQQCATWLRAIRDRYPSAPDRAAYWECRAALEERRGDLPSSVQCWENAIAAGTEKAKVEANLDHLLDKFMQLKISSSNGNRQVDPKLLDVKNVFKSTIIKFAVQQAKLCIKIFYNILVTVIRVVWKVLSKCRKQTSVQRSTKVYGNASKKELSPQFPLETNSPCDLFHCTPGHGDGCGVQTK